MSAVLPGIADLGRYVRLMSDAQHALDEASPPGGALEPAAALAFWREDAVKSLILTLQPRTMADAAVSLSLVMSEMDDLHGSVYSEAAQARKLARVRLALAGMLPVVVQAAGAPPADLVDPWSLQQSEKTFGTLDQHTAAQPDEATATGPDALLLDAYARWLPLDRERVAVQAMTGDEPEFEPRFTAHTVPWHALMRQMAGIPATTAEGRRAKAAVLRGILQNHVGIDEPQHCASAAETFAWSLANDILAN